MFIMLLFLPVLPWWRNSESPPGQVYSGSSQLPHQPYTAHCPWSSVQLATYSMWHLLPSSNEFFMSLPLALTRRRDSYQPPSVKLCYCIWQCCLWNLWPFLSCRGYRSLCCRFLADWIVHRRCNARCRHIHEIIYNPRLVEIQAHGCKEGENHVINNINIHEIILWLGSCVYV